VKLRPKFGEVTTRIAVLNTADATEGSNDVDHRWQITLSGPTTRETAATEARREPRSRFDVKSEPEGHM